MATFDPSFAFTSCQNELKRLAVPFQNTVDLSPLIEAMKSKKVVMIGEASHGTHDFYEWRSRITKELIQNHGFNFVAVEGDWPPCEELNQFIKNRRGENIYQTLSQFSRWPTWMWANSEIACFADWMRRRDSSVGFYGLDLYSLFESMDIVVQKLDQIDPELAAQARIHYSCFDPFLRNEKAYARSLFTFPEGCKDEALAVLSAILKKRVERLKVADEILFEAIQNARVVVNAEQYYRTMVEANGDSWNVRDKHMMETLEILLKHHGPNSKGIVWEHNTHIGDYRATSMLEMKQVNVGGLAREIYGDEAVGLIGFGTYRGSVIASHAWDGPTQTLRVPNAYPDSIEAECHQYSETSKTPQFFMQFDPESKKSPLANVRGHRAIGVVYDPKQERWGNYVPTSLANRYDAFIFIDKTRALTPLALSFDPKKIPETWPRDSMLGST